MTFLITGTFGAIKQVPDQLLGDVLVGIGSTCQVEFLFFNGELVTSSQIKIILKYGTLIWSGLYIK